MRTPPLRSLYICYYPLGEPLVQTQVVAYLAGLARHDHYIHLLTFEAERLTTAEKRHRRQHLKKRGIVWHSLPYHKRPTLPATIYDVLCGVLAGVKIVRRHRLQAVHARSHVPVAMGLLLQQLTGCQLIFDVRGLMAEEYVDNGNWRADSLPFRLTKAVENRALHRAEGIVVLTQRVKHYLFDEAKHRGDTGGKAGSDTGGRTGGDEEGEEKRVQVIPCCADLARIEKQSEQREAIRTHLGLRNKIVLVYVGKFGGWYQQREMVEFFATARRFFQSSRFPSSLFKSSHLHAHFLVLTQSDPQFIVEEFLRCHIPATDYTVRAVRPEAVGAYLAAADFAVSFIRACPSKIASSPTKIGEYLAAGLPVVCNRGIGDVDAIMTSHRVGVLLADYTPASYQSALREVLALMEDEDTPRRCRQAAKDNFSLDDIGIPRYHALYTALARNRK